MNFAPIVVLVGAFFLTRAEEPCWNQAVAAGVRHLSEGSFAGAEKIFLAALRDTEHFGPEHPCTATVLNDLGLVYEWLGKRHDAEKCLRGAIEIWRKICEADADSLVRSTSNLAAFYVDSGQYSKAERTGLRSLATRLESARPNDPGVVALLITLGALDRAQGRYGEAERCFMHALSVSEKLEPQSVQTMSVLTNMGRLYSGSGRRTEALSHFRRALSIGEKTLGSEHPMLVMLLVNLGKLQGPLEAEGFYKRALAIAEKTVGSQHPQVALILSVYAKALRQMRRKTQAQVCEQRARAILEATSREGFGGYTVDVSDLLRQ